MMKRLITLGKMALVYLAITSSVLLSSFAMAWVSIYFIVGTK